MQQAGRLEEKRNRIIHSIWGAGGTDGTVTRIKTTAKEKHGLRVDFEHEVKAEDLAAVADEIKQLADDTQRFWIQLVHSGKAVRPITQ